MDIEDKFWRVLNCGSECRFRFKEEVLNSPYGTLFAEINLTALKSKTLSPNMLWEDVKYSFQLYTSGTSIGFETKFRLDNSEPQKPPHMHCSGTELPCGGPLGELGQMFFSNIPKKDTKKEKSS